MSSAPALDLNPYRLLPSEPGLRSIARQLYQAVADLSIISPHGHVPAEWLADGTAFVHRTSLLIKPDHYVNRMLQDAIVQSAGISKASGFIDGTRAFCSMPARHDMSRRLAADSVAQLVAEDRLGEGQALKTIHALVVTNPRTVFEQ